MSRIGRIPVTIPSGVTASQKDGELAIKGPKGELVLRPADGIRVQIEKEGVTVLARDDERRSRQLHGLTRTLIANMVEGVTKGFSRTLEIVGVGYRAQLSAKKLTLQLGFSHPIVVEPPPGIDVRVEGVNKITVSGADKQLVGEFAARIRRLRPPEPYKGKGVRYEGERVRRKLGKAGKTAGVGVGVKK